MYYCKVCYVKHILMDGIILQSFRIKEVYYFDENYSLVYQVTQVFFNIIDKINEIILGSFNMSKVSKQLLCVKIFMIS